MTTLRQALQNLHACPESIEWLGKRRNAQKAWDECPRGDWLLWYAARTGVDRKVLVLAACACARAALVHVAEGEDRPRLAIETAEAWARGEATIDQVRKAAADAAAYSAAYYAAWSAVSAAYSAAYAAAYYAAYYAAADADAAYYAAYSATAAANAAAYAAAYAAAAYSAAAYSAAYAAAAYSAAYAAAAARTKAHADMANIVRGFIPLVLTQLNE